MTPSRLSRTSAFVASATLLLALVFGTTAPVLYGDAAHYWSLASTFTATGQFSLEGFSDQLRGYSFPLFLHAVQRAALAPGVDPLTLARVVSTLAGALLVAVAMPALVARLAGRATSPASLARLLLFSGLGALYWYGHLAYPLSDVPAALLLTVGCCALPWVDEASGHTRPWPAWRAFTAGLCLALAANIRPINEAALFPAWLLVCLHGGRARRLTPAAAFTLAVALVLWPQSRINARVYGTRNPFAHRAFDATGPNLYGQQLAWGLSIQRYETNVGGPPFPVGVIFTDATGQALVGLRPEWDPRLSASAAPTTLSGYVGFALRHPVFMASMLARHLFNGLDPAYPTPYVSRIAPRSAWLAALNYGLLGLALLRLIKGGRSMRPGALLQPATAWRVAVAGLFLLPTALAIPTAIEPRFFLSLWLLLIGMLVLDGSPTTEMAETPNPNPTSPAAPGPHVAPRAIGRWLPLLAVVGALLIGFALATHTYGRILGAPDGYSRWCLRCLP